MTPEDFDRVYYELAQALGNAPDPVLYRNRLLLIALQRLDVEDAITCIGAAELTESLDELKQPE